VTSERPGGVFPADGWRRPPALEPTSPDQLHTAQEVPPDLRLRLGPGGTSPETDQETSPASHPLVGWRGRDPSLLRR
jgi:hypothetical protein